MGAHLAGFEHERSGKAEAGGVGGITVDNSAAEMNTTVYTISESPKNGQLIWVGTDDGNIQITRDSGKNWTNVIGNVPDAGKDSWIAWVEASRYDEGTAYAAVDRHMYGDMAPHVFKTTDYGKTWKPIVATDSGVRGWAHVIKEDTVSPNLLFLGTEFGLFVSNDGGERWAQYKGSNFPAVAVDDLVVHPRTSDLVLATHGRGIWIIDDISPLRALTPEIMQEDAGFLPIPQSTQWMETFGGWPEGANSFNGQSRPDEATIPYYQRTRHIFGDLKLEIFDSQGKLVSYMEERAFRHTMAADHPSGMALINNIRDMQVGEVREFPGMIFHKVSPRTSIAQALRAGDPLRRRVRRNQHQVAGAERGGDVILSVERRIPWRWGTGPSLRSG